MSKNKEKKISAFKMTAIILLSFFVLVSVCVGGTYAYLKWQSGAISNSFTAKRSASPKINESFDGYLKENVSVTVGDTGYDVYVRAALIVTWKNADGDVLVQAPAAGKDYQTALSLTASGWFAGEDGYYYYSQPVASGEATEVLLQSCAQLRAAPKAGYTLDVRIAAQTIQAAGRTDEGDIPAVTDAWGVTLNEDRTISGPTS